MSSSLEKFGLVFKSKKYWFSMFLLNLAASYTLAKSHNASILLIFTIGLTVMILVPAILVPIMLILDKVFPWNKESQDEYMKIASGRVDSWILDFLILTAVTLWLLPNSFNVDSLKYISTTNIYSFFLFVILLRFVGKRVYIELSL